MFRLLFLYRIVFLLCVFSRFIAQFVLFISTYSTVVWFGLVVELAIKICP